MPGIDRSRVVSKDEEELDEFTCSICQDIFDEPVVTQCCRQSFCTICIHQWLEDNNTCPNDRKRLTVKQLLPAPRIVTNLLNKLKIKCENYGNKCETVLTIKEMANHMKTCNTCDSCKTSQKLLSENKKTIETIDNENQKLKKALGQSKADVLNQRKQMEKLECEIEKLKTNLDQSSKELRKYKTSKLISKESEADAIDHARSTSIIIEDGSWKVTEEEVTYLTNLAKLALSKRRSFEMVSKYIHQDIEFKQEYIHASWVIKTDFKDRVTSHSSYNKCLRLTFNSVTIVFMAYKPKLLDQN